MKHVFLISIIGFIFFELANVYFIMPMPGSQEINSLDLAYALHSWRLVIRCILAVFIIIGMKSAFATSKWKTLGLMIVLLIVMYTTNYHMAADVMFYQPKSISFKTKDNNLVPIDKIIIGIAYQGHAKAYPIQFLGYHHQVRDTIGDKQVMVTYCTVCRTGRVFEPLIHNKVEDFRLVGMDHFNAMFEDKNTKSWWRQATGEAVTGPLKGESLPEFPSVQTTLSKWIELYPNTLVMQPDHHFQDKYDSLLTYERGRLTGRLTRKDTASWQQKSWVVGVELNGASKAYDWNELQKKRIIYDVLGNKPIATILSKDNISFVVLERVSTEQTFTLVNDTLMSPENSYNFIGESLNKNVESLKRLKAYQEYWHSWKTFHPDTKK